MIKLYHIDERKQLSIFKICTLKYYFEISFTVPIFYLVYYFKLHFSLSILVKPLNYFFFLFFLKNEWTLPFTTFADLGKCWRFLIKFESQLISNLFGSRSMKAKKSENAAYISFGESCLYFPSFYNLNYRSRHPILHHISVWI